MSVALLIPVVQRMNKPAGMQNSAGRINIRHAVTLDPQEAPDPIRQSDFTNQGKPYGFPSRQQTFTSMMPGWFPATWEDDRFHGHVNSRLLSPNVGAWHYHLQGMEPFETRPNVETPPAIAYGSLFELPGVPGA